MGSWLFGGNKKMADGQSQPQPAAALRFQTSVQGKPLAIVHGQNRVAGNIIWYDGFVAIPHLVAQAGGGGGGGKGGNSNQQSGSFTVEYTYQVSVAIGFCEGPVVGYVQMWANKNIASVATLGFTPFIGSYTQTPWPFLTTNYPAAAYPYRGLSYVAQGNLDLGPNTELQNYSAEIIGTVSAGAPGFWDANPKDSVIDWLTNANYGCGFPSANLDLTMTQFSNYCRATGLLASPVLIEQREMSGFMADFLASVNSSARWSSGILTIVPWGDAAVTGNGVTYTPNVTPVYDLTLDDLLPNQGGGGTSGNIPSDSPVQCVRARRSDMLNTVKIEYLNRSSNYDPVAIDVKDQASIDVYGERASQVQSAHWFCLPDAALLSATLQLNRQQIPNTYTVTVPPKFVLVDVEDLLTLTFAAMGLDRQGIRIEEIQENEDGSFTITAEEFLGTASAPLFGAQANSGTVVNTNVDPGPINDPLIFEPTAELLGGATLEVWGAISGQSPLIWGGCNVFASFDGVNYTQIGDAVHGNARMGALTAPLPSVPVGVLVPVLDDVNTLSVDLTESKSSLGSVSHQDAVALATACYVGGEIVAYETATLTSANHYDLTGLVRGGYGTEDQIATHATGTPFARLDQGIFKVPFNQTQIGQTVSLKFQSFNIWGGGLEDLSTVPVYSYVIQGSALKSPLAQVSGVRTEFTDGFQFIYWDDVTDFRTGIRYKIYKGDSFAGAQQVGDNAHAPFVAFGTGTYWIVAYCQPVPGLYVYSESPVSITISGNMLVQNLVYTSDQKAAGWPGIFSNGVGRDGGNIRLGGSGNILTVADFLNMPDVLNYGGITTEGFYEIAPADYINVGYVANIYLNASWLAVGAPADQNILNVADFLGMPDVLGSASTQYVDARIQVATSQTDQPGDLYAAGDLYGVSPDLYGYGIPWSDWLDYVPGVYPAQMVKLRLKLTSADGATTCIAIQFNYEASVPARIDHYPNVAVPGTGLTITYEPDNASIAAPFNGGPPVGGTVHNQPFPFLNFVVVGQAGLTPIITAQDLASVTFHFEDASHTPVTVTNCSVTAEGY